MLLFIVEVFLLLWILLLLSLSLLYLLLVRLLLCRSGLELAWAFFLDAFGEFQSPLSLLNGLRS